ncbi:kinase-like protein [Hesseltinella vesiculosa]|uniref:non-specific serine/threonine protein kinase n=1 Tax=Hesseltinella vesiculosa TaxID=101127 RepID=A0A1X2G4Y2_9FUNG|nr:kinase-like protein [Hesseltinella vesiculosa]
MALKEYRDSGHCRYSRERRNDLSIHTKRNYRQVRQSLSPRFDRSSRRCTYEQGHDFRTRDRQLIRRPSFRSTSTAATVDNDDDIEEESNNEYCSGGYHPVKIGDRFANSRYIAIHKLGWGHFSTVWLIRDQLHGRYYAMKVVKSAKHYSETALDEIKMLEKITHTSPSSVGARFVTDIADHFMVDGPNGRHVCMTFQVLGENLLALIKRYDHRGIPVPLVKQIAKQMLLGLDYLHRQCGIIHTDLKPENVLMYLENVEDLIRDNLDKKQDQHRRIRHHSSGRGSHVLPSDPLGCSLTQDRNKPMSNIHIKIADLGNACWLDKHFTEDIQTRQYRSPEVIFGGKWDAGADIWSLACMIFELLTGSYLFDPQKDRSFSRDDDHLAQMIELVGPMRPEFALSGKRSREFFDCHGYLRHIRRLRYWNLEDVLYDKYSFSRKDARAIASFLLPMLQFERRATAGDLLHHSWLEDTAPKLTG